jgi:hypothetical protein
MGSLRYEPLGMVFGGHPDGKALRRRHTDGKILPRLQERERHDLSEMGRGDAKVSRLRGQVRGSIGTRIDLPIGLSCEMSNECAGCDTLLRTRQEVEGGFCYECEEGMYLLECAMETFLR